MSKLKLFPGHKQKSCARQASLPTRPASPPKNCLKFWTPTAQGHAESLELKRSSYGWRNKGSKRRSYPAVKVMLMAKVLNRRENLKRLKDYVTWFNDSKYWRYFFITFFQSSFFIFLNSNIYCSIIDKAQKQMYSSFFLSIVVTGNAVQWDDVTQTDVFEEFKSR